MHAIQLMMDSNNSADLDTSDSSSGRGEENVPEKVNTVPDENNFPGGTSQTNEDIPTLESVDEVDMDIEEEEGQHLPTLNVEVESLQKDPILVESMGFIESVTTLEKLTEAPEQDQEGGHAIVQNGSTKDNFLVDESRVKRARLTSDDQQPTVHLVYKSLTRESKNKLMQLMQHWSEWQAQSQYSSDVSPKDASESGEETYFPALNISSGRSSAVSFWLDNKGRKEETNDIQLENEAVPLYDRGYTLGSTSLDGSANLNRIETLDASRCFNCGSYNHMLNQCPKPRNRFAISNARRQHSSKRNQPTGPRVQVRYYQKSSGKIDDIKPRVLGAEARESLGAREFDPPPSQHQMRELGHPPEYLEMAEDEDQPSGITIFSEEAKEEYEEGELPEKAEPEKPLRKMTSEVPGIYAPIPANADQRLWGVQAAGFSGSNSFTNRSYSRLNHSSESHRDHYRERWSSDHRDDRLPTGDYGPSFDMQGRYSPRYSPYDQHPALKSPVLGRSFSDRESRSALPYKRSSPIQSPRNLYSYPPPPPPPGTNRQPSHHSLTTSVERWNHDSSCNSPISPSVSAQQTRDRHDHLRHHSRR